MTTLSPRFTNDNTIEIGIDEAGRGSFWGPIVAGATIIPPESEWTDAQKSLFTQLRDSKKLSPKKRAILSKALKENLPYWGVGVVGAEEINTEGITWANREAFRRACYAVPIQKHEDCRLLIDGILALDKWIGQQQLIIEGDNQYMAIAAASILAKVAHDEWITAYCDAHPECEERYHLRSSNGYGTAKHREGIRLYGGHELHRDQYIQNWLPGSTRVPKTKTKSKKNTVVGSTDKCLIQFA
jgi:ribonuclease HII